MPTNLLTRLSLAIGIALATSSCSNKITTAKSAFIDTMVTKHQFDAGELQSLLEAAEIKDDILQKMAKPAESMPWYKYRQLFITEARIDGGIKFWQENRQALATAEQRYGVPAAIIVAIIGVETRYGQVTGKHRVIDALSTLAFAYPRRAPFFVGELENFLLLCREEQSHPLTPTGSYAGAMGIPQFMPSSFRQYATDFDGDGRRDIWHNNGDAIASVAHYFAKHGWQTGQAVALPINANAIDKDTYDTALTGSLKPDLSVADLESPDLKKSLSLDTKVKLLAFAQDPEEQKPSDELWAVLDNFICIMRYNHSPLYAMAVYQLSQAILK